MLNKRLIFMSGTGAVALTATLIVFTIQTPTETQNEVSLDVIGTIPPEILDILPEPPNDYPVMYGGGFPPPKPLDSSSIGDELSETVPGSKTQYGIAPQVNPEYAKYEPLTKIIDEYTILQVYVDREPATKTYS